MDVYTVLDIYIRLTKIWEPHNKYEQERISNSPVSFGLCNLQKFVQLITYAHRAKQAKPL